MNPDYVGYVFGTDCFVFGLCSVIYSYTCINYPRKIVFVMGLALAGMTFLMMGPSLLFDFPNENYLTIGSFFPLGVI
jgi:nucleoside recognition membrane protein YjiH